MIYSVIRETWLDVMPAWTVLRVCEVIETEYMHLRLTNNPWNPLQNLSMSEEAFGCV